METIYFDMDGTIVDFYSQENWRESLQNEDITPFLLAKPLFDAWVLSSVLRGLQAKGAKIGVISWLPPDASPRYAAQVDKAKRHWLKENLYVPLNEIHILPYGTNKREVAADNGGILFDDETPNREKWGYRAYAPQDILPVLLSLL